ncbi:MAG: hypothetical protein KDE27_28125 [Planctomycetes bacterium]|nr:hypothetical protein [Planctomycetota bacterium]
MVLSPRTAKSRPQSDGHRLVRHIVATLAYRAGKALRRYPVALRERRIGATTRTPLELLSHLGDLVEWGERMARGEKRWAPAPIANWRAGEARFFAGLAALDRVLARRRTANDALEQLIQGPLADALTHVGQLALLRGVGGSRVRPESYARAAIAVGTVGREQPEPRAEFDGDASFPAGTAAGRRTRRR